MDIAIYFQNATFGKGVTGDGKLTAWLEGVDIKDLINEVGFGELLEAIGVEQAVDYFGLELKRDE